MTWLERDDARERIEWIASARAAARVRAAQRMEDQADVAFMALIGKARIAVAKSSADAIARDNARFATMDAWEYRELLSDKGRRFISAENDLMIVAALLATLDLIPPKT